MDLTWEILNVGLNVLAYVVSKYNFQIKFVSGFKKSFQTPAIGHMSYNSGQLILKSAKKLPKDC